MSHGPLSVFTGITVASGASTSGEVDLARAWKTVYLDIGTMSTGMAVGIWAAHALAADGGVYRPVYHPTINSATVATSQFLISGVVGTNGGTVPIPNGFRYFKVVLTGVVSGGALFKAICSD